MSWFIENPFWKDWTNECHSFDRSIEDLWQREDLTEAQKEDMQNQWLESFNKKMNNKQKGEIK